MDQEKIGKFIAEQRKKQKLTQEELASKLGVSNRSVSNWENGKNMPDLSLFKPLCEILGISINELLSGEKINNKKYQDKLTENIINLTIDSKKRLVKTIKRMILIIVLLFIILFAGLCFYNYYEIDVKYDERTMKCNFDNGVLTYNIIGNSVLNTYRITRTINNKKYIIFHSTINLYNKRNSNWEYGESFARLLNGEDVPYGFYWKFDKEKSTRDEVAYYTNKSLNKIKKLNDEEFLQELQESYKMCSKKGIEK